MRPRPRRSTCVDDLEAAPETVECSSQPKIAPGTACLCQSVIDMRQPALMLACALGIVVSTQEVFSPARYRAGAAPGLPTMVVGGGQVILELAVNRDGRVTAVTPLRTTPPSRISSSVPCAIGNSFQHRRLLHHRGPANASHGWLLKRRSWSRQSFAHPP